MLNLLHSCNASIVKLDGWIMDDNLFPLISAIPARTLWLWKCEVILTESTTNNVPQQSDTTAVKRLILDECGLTLSVDAFWQCIYSRYLNLNELEFRIKIDETKENVLALKIPIKSCSEERQKFVVISSSPEHLLEMLQSQLLQRYESVEIKILKLNNINGTLQALLSHNKSAEILRWDGADSNFNNCQISTILRPLWRLKMLIL